MLALERLQDNELLKTRFCELPLNLDASPTARRVEAVARELKAAGMIFAPTVWLAEEWYNPDGICGYAIPFYLAHPRLILLERRMMLEAEGVQHGECMRILRHETGHAIDEAFQLFRTQAYSRVFGSASRRYPREYEINPRTDAYVTNLNAWYAQSHPVEDFAETFAIWLGMRQRWRHRYAGTRALAKLATVDRLLRERAGQPPEVAPKARESELAHNERTLAEHYEEKRAFYRIGAASEYDEQLERLFPRGQRSRGGSIAASTYLRARKRLIRERAAAPLGVPAYTVDQVVRQLSLRAAALGLKANVETQGLDGRVAATVETIVRRLVQSSPRLPL